jgi:S-adenosylmethionine:tRNA ribosyltransferase-isomerase
MLVADFHFELPESLIAQEARPRGTSRLMVVDRARGTWTDATIAELPSVLAPGDLMVVNDTRVFPARLLGRRDPSGGAVECFLLTRRSATEWDTLMSPAQRLSIGARVVFEHDRAPGIRLHGEIRERGDRGRRVVAFAVEGAASVDAAIDGGPRALAAAIRRPDTKRSRTLPDVYARERGSVAAPTAGLHFDEAGLPPWPRVGCAARR